jgi:hypothetical protein
MKAYVEVEVHFHTFLTSASDAGFTSKPLDLSGKIPQCPLGGGFGFGLVDLGAGFDHLGQINGP